MAKIHKISLYVIDRNEEFGDDIVETYLVNKGLDCHTIDYKTTQSFDYDDNHPINQLDRTEEDIDMAFYENYNRLICQYSYLNDFDELVCRKTSQICLNQGYKLSSCEKL